MTAKQMTVKQAMLGKLSPSMLAVHAFEGLSVLVQGEIKDYTCNLCGLHFEDGGHAYKQGAKFNDQIATHGTNAVCPACAVVSKGSSYMNKNKCAVYFPEGFYTLGKDLDLACFLTFPPKPPFVAVFSHKKQQHLVWRARLTLDEHLFAFQYGDQSYLIDRQHIAQMAAEYGQVLAQINEAVATKKLSSKKPLTSFFAVNTGVIRKGNAVEAGSINTYLPRMMDELNEHGFDALSNRLAKLLGRLNQLNEAELFLMLPLTKFTRDELLAYAEDNGIPTQF